CCLVGIRSTMGLTSRDGIVPLYLRNDVGGPICRTVEDAVRVLDIIAGYDPMDPITKISRGKKPDSYLKYLDSNGLKDKRIGAFRYYTDKSSTDPEIKKIFNIALRDMEKKGVILVDPFTIPDFDELTEDIWCNTFKRDLKKYLESLENPPIKSVEAVYESGLYSDYIGGRLKRMAESDPDPGCGDIFTEPKNIRLRKQIIDKMNEYELDAFVYPTWSNPPRLIGDMESPAGDNSQKIPPHTGLPGFTVPMGYSHRNLPAGLQIVGKLFSEPTLIEIAYDYEQTTMHRKPPKGFN
ncbi:MAG: amidase family protein, partial [archaeon]